MDAGRQPVHRLGHPKTCLGAYGPDQTDPLGYGDDSYHSCGGVPTPCGTTGFTPWTHQLNISIDYRPDWAQKKLEFNLGIFNVFNEQRPLQYAAGFGQTPIGVISTYNTVTSTNGFEAPRFARFSIAYNW